MSDNIPDDHPNNNLDNDDAAPSSSVAGSTTSGTSSTAAPPPSPDSPGDKTSRLLQNLVLDSSDVHGFLDTLAQHAADQLSSRDHDIRCGITLLRPRVVETVASSDETAQAMDEVQYRLDEGPCLDAARTNQTNHVRNVTTDSRWPQYLRAIAEIGVRSILSVPIPLEGDANCALNLYSSSTRAFTDEDIRDAEDFAATTSSTLQLAIRIAQLTDAQENLTSAMRSRTTIDLAAGIIMAQNRCSQDAAMTILKAASSARNSKLRDVAASVIGSISGLAPTTHFDH